MRRWIPAFTYLDNSRNMKASPPMIIQDVNLSFRKNNSQSPHREQKKLLLNKNTESWQPYFKLELNLNSNRNHNMDYNINWTDRSVGKMSHSSTQTQNSKPELSFQKYWETKLPNVNTESYSFYQGPSNCVNKVKASKSSEEPIQVWADTGSTNW